MKSGLFFTLFVAIFCPLANASIGLNSSTIPTDCNQLKGVYSVVNAGSQYECKTVSGTVDFYTNSQNVITNITWKGRNTPALDVLLGSFRQEYIDAVKNSTPSKGLKRSARSETANIIVKRGGNARTHVGEIVLKSAAQ